MEAELHYEVWAGIMRALQDPGFPVRYTRLRSIDDYEALGLVCKTASTLGEALQRMIRYTGLLTDTFECRVHENNSALHLDFLRVGARGLGLRAAAEATLAEVLSAMRAIVGEPLPLQRVRFAHAAPPDLRAHREFFGAPLLFEAPCDGLEFERAAGLIPVKLADPGLSRFLMEHLDKQKSQVTALRSELHRAILDALPEGAPRVESIAKQLKVSPRTLQRRLQEEQTSFGAQVDEARHALALALVRSDRPLKEVAFLLGFSQQSAFARAFRRWTGSAPSRYREGSKRADRGR